MRVSTELFKAVPLLQFAFIRACFYWAFQGGSFVAIRLVRACFYWAFQGGSSATIWLCSYVFLRRFLCCKLSGFVLFLLHFTSRFLCCNLILFVRVCTELSKVVPLLQFVWARACFYWAFQSAPLLQFVWVCACFYRVFQGGSSIAIWLCSCVFLLSFSKRFLCCNLSGVVRVFLLYFPRWVLCWNLTEHSLAIPLLQFVWRRACFYWAFKCGSPVAICLGSYVFLLSCPRLFLSCSLFLFVYRWFHMWRLHLQSIWNSSINVNLPPSHTWIVISTLTMESLLLGF